MTIFLQIITRTASNLFRFPFRMITEVAAWAGATAAAGLLTANSVRTGRDAAILPGIVLTAALIAMTFRAFDHLGGFIGELHMTVRAVGEAGFGERFEEVMEATGKAIDEEEGANGGETVRSTSEIMKDVATRFIPVRDDREENDEVPKAS